MFKLSGNVLSRFSILFATLTLAACGGGSSGSSTNVDNGGSGETPEDTSSGSDDFKGESVQDYFVGDNATLKAGVFLGQVNYRDDATPPVEGLMLLSPTGNFTFILATDSVDSLNTNILSGTLTLDDSRIEGSAVEYELFEEWYRATGVIGGDVVTEESALLYPGGIVDNAEINRVSEVSDQGISTSLIAGIYETDGSDPQITIDVDGGINGVDRGCIIEGQITIPVPEINTYELSYEASGCSDLAEATGEERDGDYLGVGTFTPADGESEAGNEFAASNGKIAFYFAGTR